MNRKIFTLLASALMLFSTAFYANARNVAQKSVGAVVTTLPTGYSDGMYHIRIDSICLATGLNGSAEWHPVSYDGVAPGGVSYLQYDPIAKGYELDNTAAVLNDTMVLSIAESGHVIMVSASDLRNKLGSTPEGAKLADLQATMWCTNVEDPAALGQYPTFHFTNKVFGDDLDYFADDYTQVGGSERGWMFSPGYKNGHLDSMMPLRRLEDYEDPNDDGKYRVIKAELNATNTMPTGVLYTKKHDIEDFVADTIVGMLKFTIVKVAPFVLSASDFNTQLGNVDPDEEKVKLKFNPTPSQDNLFGYYLKAETSTNGTAAGLGYLNVRTYNENNESSFNGYIANRNKEGGDQYNNESGDWYLNLLPRSTVAGTDSTGDYNYSYRFVYFPSEDSLVINAYHVSHHNHSYYGTATTTDIGAYISDAPGAVPYYYGLYYHEVHDALIVRYQDLNGVNGASSMMTIGRHPANVRIYFGINNCSHLIDSWQVPQGVYTIWDTRGYVLGVRIYNGSFTPQWLQLDEGECPDRIPSYQWTIEPSAQSKGRIDIYNREFGNLAPESTELVAMMNVRVVKNAPSKIFSGSNPQFIYDPIALNFYTTGTYEPIIYASVYGQLLNAIGPQECGITMNDDKGGFRPVTKEYVVDPYLGYKHFTVGKDPTKVDYGKSEDIGNEKGMDYNAFSFNYLNPRNETSYIGLEPRYNDTMLHIEEQEGFQFMLGTYHRTHQYQEERFGYPVGGWTGPLKIEDSETGYSYVQPNVPQLSRYYYELKVADYYDYRDGLAEQYVVLKGAKEDNSDIKNALMYGVADVWADKDPFKFTNVYLRESYFLTKEKTLGEERHKEDPTRRIYYALLDRIEAEQIQRVTSMGLQVSDILIGDDGTAKYALVSMAVDDKNLWIAAQGKVTSSVRVSTFFLENVNYPLYRRLRSLRDDNASPEGDGLNPELGAELGTNLDAPKVLRIYRENNKNEYLYEDALSDISYGKGPGFNPQTGMGGINFLGATNSTFNKEEVAPDGTVKYNYHLFIDTAFINRGTGWIKPQYLIAVGTEVVGAETIRELNNCGQEDLKVITPYIEGRYLINATDSARGYGSDGRTQIINDDYAFPGSWDRLVFVPAIHIGDRLYIVSQLEKAGIKRSQYIVTRKEDGKEFIWGDKLNELVDASTNSYARERRPENSAMYGAYYDFGTWNNYHNDVCFSLRFTHPNVQNPDANGDDVSTNSDKRFYIESETTNRTVYGNRKIAPVQGGWIKLENNVPVIDRTSYEDGMGQGEMFNVAVPTDWQDGEATSNDNVTSKVTVVSGNDQISILNAEGKKVIISNVVGQNLVNTVLKSNNETIQLSKGIVIVSVEGEKAFKTIVK